MKYYGIKRRAASLMTCAAAKMSSSRGEAKQKKVGMSAWLLACCAPSRRHLA